MSDFERALLTKMTDVKELTLIYEMGLRAEVFGEKINGVIFDWMIEYWHESRQKHAPTWAVMSKEYPGVEFPAEVDESTEWLVDYLKRLWLQNKGQELVFKTASALDEAPLPALSALWQEAYAITETVAPRLARVDMSATVAQRRAGYLHKAESPRSGMTLGVTELDTHTRGLQPGELGVVAAYTKVGKTFFLTKAGVEARKLGYTPLIITLEQSVDEITERADAVWSGVSYARLQAGALSFEDVPVLDRAHEEMERAGPFLVEKPQRGERTVRNIVNRARQVGADYLIIDQLSFLDGSRSYQGDRAMTQRHGDLMFELKDEINRESAGRIPCLMAVQFNRDTMRDRSAAGKGELHNFAHSSLIEQTADLCISLWRSGEMRAMHMMGLSIIGSRRSDLGEWMLNWRLGDRTEISMNSVLER